jgi:hypothetical protein
MIKYVAEYKEDRIKFNPIASSGVITSLFLDVGFIAVFYFASGLGYLPKYSICRDYQDLR